MPVGPCGLIIEAFGPEIRPWLRRAERLFYPRLGDRPRDVPPLRDAAAPTFSPDGLYFLGPVYDEAFGLPVRTPAFDWLP